MKGFLIFMAIVFAVATIFLYNASIIKQDSYNARILGVSETINIQATVFCAATAIMCVINIVGAVVISSLEKKEESTKDEKTIEGKNPVVLSDEDLKFLSAIERVDSVEKISIAWEKASLGEKYPQVDDYINRQVEAEKKIGSLSKDQLSHFVSMIKTKMLE